MAVRQRLFTEVWQQKRALPDARADGCAVAFQNQLYYLGGINSRGQIEAAVFIYDPPTDSWRRGPPLPGPRHHATAVVFNKWICVLGGYKTMTYIPTAEVLLFDHHRNRWVPGLSLPEPRAGHSAAATDTTIFIAGGDTLLGTSSDFVWYHLQDQVWDQPITSVGQWDHIRSLPTARQNMASAAMGSLFLTAGGTRVTHSEIIHDSLPAYSNFEIHRNFSLRHALAHAREPDASENWINGPPLPTPRWNAASAALQHLFIVAGGQNETGVVSTVEVFDTRRSQWYRLPDLPKPCQGGSGVCIGNTFYIIGGGQAPGISLGDQIYALTMQPFL